jgi:hypothetical protein
MSSENNNNALTTDNTLTTDTNTSLENDNTCEDNIEVTEKDKQEIIEKITKYRNIALSFIETHRKELAQIYLQHTKSAQEDEALGVLGINMVEMEEKQNIDVAFLPAKLLPLELVNTILERHKTNNENIIYFLLISQLEEKIIELDIRTLLE